MRRCFLLLFLAIITALFAGNDWDDNEEDDFQAGSPVSYGGIEFYCDSGCGDPDYDGDASTIQYFFCSWLSKPLYGSHFKSWEENYYSSQWNINPWTEGLLFDPSKLEKYFYAREFDVPHNVFIEISSNFLRDLNQVVTEYQAEMTKCIQREMTIKQLQSQGAAFVEYEDDDSAEEITGYTNRTYESDSIETALQSTRRQIQFWQNEVEKCDLFCDYAQDTFQIIDSLYKKIFTWCLEYHQPEGIAFRAALEDFLSGDFDSALDRIQFLIRQAEDRQWDNALIAKLCFLSGQLENEMCLYSDAIIDLTRSIQNNPEYKEAYFERARAYFEIGQFEQALQDYLASGVKSTPIDPGDLNLAQFAAGMMTGVSQGALQGTVEFIPSMLTSIKTLGSGLWAFAKDPIEVSSEFAHSALALLQAIQSGSDAIALFVPELKELMQSWDSLSSFQRGKSCGHIIGVYGIDILLQIKSAKIIKSYTELRRAAAIQSFEASAATEANAAGIAKAARDAQLRREAIGFLDPNSRLKNAVNAVLPKEKFTQYALTNTGKVKGFREVLGYNESNWQNLQSQIKQGILESQARYHATTQYGVQFSVDMYIQGPKGSAVVRTGWIYDINAEHPRLVTLHLIDKKDYYKNL